MASKITSAINGKYVIKYACTHVIVWHKINIL